MELARYLDVDAQLLVKNARQVPISAALIKAAEVKIKELQTQAVERAGTIDPRDLELMLVRAQGLQWIVELPDKIRKTSNNEE
jgi:hypothetical protein